MINKITLNNVATYSDVELEPMKINFIYGGNGTGKTSLSRVINGVSEGSYQIHWHDDTPLNCLVFNKDFVRNNIRQKMNGIFTLGEEDIGAVEQLAQLNDQINESERNIAVKKHSIEAKQEELKSAFRQFADSCWGQKRRFKILLSRLKDLWEVKKRLQNDV